MISWLFNLILVFLPTSNAEVPKVVFIGDSLTQGYGVQPDQAFPEQLKGLLKLKGVDIEVLNGGISGSMTADADRRVRFYSRVKPSLLVVCLGANDGLKATPTNVIKRNLKAALVEAEKLKIPTLLIGMKIFNNYGETYSKDFEAVFQQLAREHKLVLFPFLLEGVALNKDLMQADAKHPNSAGHAVVAKNLLPVVLRELKKLERSRKL